MAPLRHLRSSNSLSFSSLDASSAGPCLPQVNIGTPAGSILSEPLLTRLEELTVELAASGGSFRQVDAAEREQLVALGGPGIGIAEIRRWWMARQREEKKRASQYGAAAEEDIDASEEFSTASEGQERFLVARIDKGGRWETGMRAVKSEQEGVTTHSTSLDYKTGDTSPTNDPLRFNPPPHRTSSPPGAGVAVAPFDTTPRSQRFSTNHPPAPSPVRTLPTWSHVVTSLDRHINGTGLTMLKGALIASAPLEEMETMRLARIGVQEQAADIVFLPCHRLHIGKWMRLLALKEPELLLYYSPENASLNFWTSHTGRAFRIILPLSFISSLQLLHDPASYLTFILITRFPSSTPFFATSLPVTGLGWTPTSHDFTSNQEASRFDHYIVCVQGELQRVVEALRKVVERGGSTIEDNTYLLEIELRDKSPDKIVANFEKGGRRGWGEKLFDPSPQVSVAPPLPSHRSISPPPFNWEDYVNMEMFEDDEDSTVEPAMRDDSSATPGLDDCDMESTDDQDETEEIEMPSFSYPDIVADSKHPSCPEFSLCDPS